MNNLQLTIIEKNNRINHQAKEIVNSLLEEILITEEDIIKWFKSWKRVILSLGAHILKRHSEFLEKGKEIKKSGFPWNKTIAKEFGNILKQLKRNDSLVDTYTEISSEYTLLNYLAFGKLIPGVTPKKISSIFPDINVKKIICGNVHAMIITTEGHVYTWGDSSCNRLGREYNGGVYPERVEELEGIVEGACGYSHTFVIDCNGFLWGWGNVLDGRLGVEPEFTMDEIGDLAGIPKPKRITASAPIWTVNDDDEYIEEEVLFKSIMAGSTFSIALSLDNQLYTWGERGYNGLTSDINIYRPTKMLTALYFRSISIGSGGYHALALSMAGYVYSWGHNQVGQVGKPVVETDLYDRLNDNSYSILRPYIVPTPCIMEFSRSVFVKSISAGWGHSLFLTINGTVMSCGRNTSGQLGSNPEECQINTKGNNYRYQVGRIDGLCNITQIGAGGKHSLAVDSSGHIWTWGLNNNTNNFDGDVNILGRDFNGNSTYIPNVCTIKGNPNTKPNLGFHCSFVPIED